MLFSLEGGLAVGDVPIKAQPQNAHWMDTCFGEETTAQLEDAPISCAGALSAPCAPRAQGSSATLQWRRLRLTGRAAGRAVCAGRGAPGFPGLLIPRQPWAVAPRACACGQMPQRWLPALSLVCTACNPSLRAGSGLSPHTCSAFGSGRPPAAAGITIGSVAAVHAYCDQLLEIAYKGEAKPKCRCAALRAPCRLAAPAACSCAPQALSGCPLPEPWPTSCACRRARLTRREQGGGGVGWGGGGAWGGESACARRQNQEVAPRARPAPALQALRVGPGNTQLHAALPGSSRPPAVRPPRATQLGVAGAHRG